MMRGVLLAVCTATATVMAHAHTEAVATNSFLAGVLHPLTGLDHLLAMVAVGIWGATLGAPLLWALPVVFPLLMVIGGVLGIAGIPLPYVETGVALSVLVLGLAILAAWKAPVVMAVSLVALFGILHGHAHGTELPGSATPAAYSIGFVLATGALHMAGVALGMLDSKRRGSAFLRVCGGLIAAVGIGLLIGQFGN